MEAEQLAGATVGGLLFGAGTGAAVPFGCGTGVAALDGEGAGVDGREGASEGVPPPSLAAVGESDVAGRAFGEGAGAHPVITRARPAIKMPTPSFRLPIRRPTINAAMLVAPISFAL